MMVVKKVIIWPNKIKTILQTKTEQLQNILREKILSRASGVKVRQKIMAQLFDFFAIKNPYPENLQTAGSK